MDGRRSPGGRRRSTLCCLIIQHACQFGVTSTRLILNYTPLPLA